MSISGGLLISCILSRAPGYKDFEINIDEVSCWLASVRLISDQCHLDILRPRGSAVGHVTIVVISRTIILVPSVLIELLQLIWRLSTVNEIYVCPHFQLSCRRLEYTWQEYQDSSAITRSQGDITQVGKVFTEQSGTKPKLVAKILATNFGFVPDSWSLCRWMDQKWRVVKSNLLYQATSLVHVSCH